MRSRKVPVIYKDVSYLHVSGERLTQLLDSSCLSPGWLAGIALGNLPWKQETPFV